VGHLYAFEKNKLEAVIPTPELFEFMRDWWEYLGNVKDKPNNLAGDSNLLTP
jgi:hypothetical protein